MGYKMWLYSRLWIGLSIFAVAAFIRLNYAGLPIGISRSVALISAVILLKTCITGNIGTRRVNLYFPDDCPEEDVSGQLFKIPVGLFKFSSGMVRMPPGSISGPGKMVEVEYRPGERPVVIGVS